LNPNALRPPALKLASRVSVGIIPSLQASTPIQIIKHNRGTATRDFMEASSIGYENVLDW
jgi:hypothetical protein